MDFDDKVSREEQELAEFERRLRSAMQHHEAPLGMKQRVLARARERRQREHGRLWILQRVGVSVVLATVFASVAVYREVQERATERKKGEEAREQVMTALRITNKTLNRVSERLAENSK